MTSIDKKEWIEKIDQVLETVRPHLIADGGDVEVVDVTEDFTVSIQWKGNCQNCDMSAMTLKAGIEQAIKVKYPEVQKVEAVNSL
jgi:Fe-S cluster biogenesis protein NfuA